MNNMDITEILNNEDVHRHIKNATKTVAIAVYNELYIYIWIICIYNVLLFAIALVSLVMLIKYTHLGRQNIATLSTI